jgi:hypothetical protein
MARVGIHGRSDFTMTARRKETWADIAARLGVPWPPPPPPPWTLADAIAELREVSFYKDKARRR